MHQGQGIAHMVLTFAVRRSGYPGRFFDSVPDLLRSRGLVVQLAGSCDEDHGMKSGVNRQ